MTMIKGVLFAVLCILTLPAFTEPTTTDSADLILRYKPMPDKSSVHNAVVFKWMKLAEKRSIKNEPSVKISKVLQALVLPAEALDTAGHGDVYYWMRNAVDFARTGRAMGMAISKVVAHLNKGPVQIAMATTAKQLTEISPGKEGNVWYWRNRSIEITEQVKTATDQIVSLSHKLNDESINAHSALIALSTIITSPSVAGNGDKYYWRRVSWNLSLLGHKCGDALQQISNSLPEPLYSVLITYVNQLNNIKHGGDCDLQYCARYAEMISKKLDEIGEAIVLVSEKTLSSLQQKN